MKTRMINLLVCVFACAISLGGEYPYVSACPGSGTYEIDQAGTDFVLSGNIGGDVTVTLPENCRVTLSGVTMSGVLTINGDAELWLVGESDVAVAGASAIVCSGTLTIGGTGVLEASAAGAKKTGVISATSLEVAGGTTALTIANPTAKNACGVSLSGDYVQTDGTLTIVGMSGDYKQNGVFLSKKNGTATISGGTLDVTLAGEKSVGLAMDKDSISGTMSGGSLKFTMSGNGAKGVKGDGAFTMTGGTLDATLTGGVAEDYFEYEDGNDVTWNYYVTLTSSTKTSGGTATYNTSALIANGTYPVMDPSKCYAVKVGTLEISGGAVTVSATGTAGRGLGADNMTLSGGTYDITVAGGPTAVYVESLVESDDLNDTTYASGVPTCLDAGGAACLKTSGTDGVLTISGGTFNLKATGDAGKLINAAGYLVIGTEGQTTLPTDDSFSPDISGYTTGSRVYCTAIKQKYYGTLATAMPTADLGSLALSVASDNLVRASSASAGQPGGQGGPGGEPPGGAGGGGAPGGMPGGDAGGGADDDADYSNPKGVKGYSGVTVHGGRLVVTTKNDGGEGLESKNALTINGGVLDLQCYDDCINSGGDLYLNGGYVYALSTGNDSIDSNGNIYMTGGVVLAFSTAGGAEVGIDTDNSSGLVISGGHLVAVGGAADNMVIGSSGSQKTYRNTSVSASTYSGKYLSMTGTGTFAVKMPTLSGTISLVCTTEGWTSAGTPKASDTAPSLGSLGFHDTYLFSSDGTGADTGTDTGTTTGAGATTGAGTGISSARTYDGYVLSDGMMAGRLTLKVGRTNRRTGLSKFKATIYRLGTKKAVYSAKAAINASAATTVKLVKSSGSGDSALSLTISGNTLLGSVGDRTIVGVRNQSAAREARAAEYAARKGRVYNVVLSASNPSGSGASFANGYSVLAVKIMAKGKASVTGTMSDGKRVSGSGLQMILAEEGSGACLPVLVPMYTGKRGGFAFLLWIASDGTLSVTGLSKWDASCSAAAPFTAELSCVDMAALAPPSDGQLLFSVDAEAFPATIGDLPVLSNLLPNEVPVTVASGRMKASQADESKLRISRTASTGLLKGTFKMFLQQGERTKQQSVQFKGVVVNGKGYGAATVKKAGAVAVKLE
ncbi:MAG: carbohydrate-binding domain-containing protein [Kiritimatiellae bacterium]|nr:carbohydrate-binding domain-containing protein [Kiritimatiellia bacterium]